MNINEFPRGVPSRDLRYNIAPFASWLDSKIITSSPHWRYETGKMFVGVQDGVGIGVRDNRHSVSIAGNRAGKGVSSIVPNLIEYTGSMLVIDPKGENAALTASRRGHGSKNVKVGLGQDVHVLDPFGRSGHATARCSLLKMINPEDEACVDVAALLAEALIMMEEGSGRHWSAGGRNFTRALLLHTRTQVSEEHQTLPRFRAYLTLGDKDFAELLAAMSLSDACFGVIARGANALIAKSENERSGIISTIIEQTDFLDSPAMARCLSGNDFDLGDLKRRPTTVYMCLPAMQMGTHNRWLRMIINMALYAIENDRTRPALPVVFMMDEFAVLERLESVEKAAGLIAGAGAIFDIYLQDIGQLKSIYKDRWETFLGNAGLLRFFGNSDMGTLDYVSRRIGKTTMRQVNESEISTQQIANGFTGESTSLQVTELMTAEEISRYFARQEENQLLIWPGSNPIAIDRVRYYDHPYFAGKFDPQPA